MLVDNKVYLFVEAFSRLEDRLVASEQARVFPFQKRVQIQLQHACIRAFTLDLSLPTTIKPNFSLLPAIHYELKLHCAWEGKQRNQIDLAWWKWSWSSLVDVSLGASDFPWEKRDVFLVQDVSPPPIPSRVFTSRFSCAFWLLLTETRWKNHDRSKYSTRQSRLARNDISVVLAFAV